MQVRAHARTYTHACACLCEHAQHPGAYTCIRTKARATSTGQSTQGPPMHKRVVLVHCVCRRGATPWVWAWCLRLTWPRRSTPATGCCRAWPSCKIRTERGGRRSAAGTVWGCACLCVLVAVWGYPCVIVLSSFPMSLSYFFLICTMTHALISSMHGHNFLPMTELLQDTDQVHGYYPDDSRLP